jgi:glycerate 2-kinase
MKVLIAPDKFKGTLTATEVCQAIASGLRKAIPNIEIRNCPLADGGEGTLDVFLFHSGGSLITVDVHDPLMRKVEASYGLSHDGKTAFIEMARASGLELIQSYERNPLKTTSYGTGELIRDALNRNVSRIILGIGGSATNDAATGAVAALGGQFYDADRHKLFPSGENLCQIDHFNLDELHPGIQDIELIAICDVANPFYGEHGAACVYAPQKGASSDDVIILDEGLRKVARCVMNTMQIDLQRIAGSGAGGGFAGGCLVFLNGKLRPGIDVILSITHVDEAMKWADVVITGEGKLDQQTLQGKVIAGVATKAAEQRKKLIVVCGINALSESEWRTLSIDAVFSLTDYAGREEAIMNSALVVQRLAGEHIAWALKQKR